MKLVAMQTSIILLAAGKGLRFTQHDSSTIKQLAMFEKNTLLQHAINQLQPLQHNQECHLYIALGANRSVIEATLPTSVTTISSENWHLGMGHTLADSIDFLTQQKSATTKNDTADITHIMLALVDQPLITLKHYQTLLGASRDNPNNIIATQSNKVLMPPAIFPRQYFDELRRLTGDVGAAKILKKYRNDVISINNNKAQFDTDTPEQLARVVEHM